MLSRQPVRRRLVPVVIDFLFSGCGYQVVEVLSAVIPSREGSRLARFVHLIRGRQIGRLRSNVHDGVRGVVPKQAVSAAGHQERYRNLTVDLFEHNRSSSIVQEAVLVLT